MNDHNLAVDKKGDTPVNNKKAMKNAARKRPVKIKPSRRIDAATERMAFRVTKEMKVQIQQAAIDAVRTDSNYIREVMSKHLASLPPPGE
jgi:hypothetical protein